MTAFFDTNVVFYCFDGRIPAKRDLARRLWREHSLRGTAVISTQVLAEFIHAVRRKL